ncbi:5-methyltetrahydropteroyltriglutamate--homocysteine S-methyltransferase [Spirochaeta cellobiosiphila]|uniref:5-methyltetrahydropteroyltriglutamate-- homocysteine S-methyltransferase n=1 Tax=Spirochaeta cellobiosiphila TaxID=504483 RepID=UPI00040F888A|nr:5-methyltetrahydropteroyltriglutamate--homocysteine S-methyltransferase [Spirochaeta cellobiosiphila]
MSYNPFRYDIVGSYLRPQVLKQARDQFLQGQISEEELQKVEDQEILKLIAKQKSLGLKAVTDGEFRRSWWHLDFMWGFKGIRKTDLQTGYPFQGVETRKETAQLEGKVEFDGTHPFLKHFTFLKEAVGEELIPRQTIPAPSQLLSELQRPENQPFIEKYYDSEEELAQDIALAYQGFIQAIYDLGCRHLQLDDCTWGMLSDKKFRDNVSTHGVDLDQMADTFSSINNKAIEKRPDDLQLTTHVCRGNFRSTWAGSGGYDPIAPQLLGKEKVDAYYLEFDTDRAGDFTPLKELTDNKHVVLGLVSSKIGELEKKEEVIARIKEAAKIIPLDRLSLSTQCGFASTEEGNVLSEEQQWNKISFVKEVAEEVWAEVN